MHMVTFCVAAQGSNFPGPVGPRSAKNTVNAEALMDGPAVITLDLAPWR